MPNQVKQIDFSLISFSALCKISDVNDSVVISTAAVIKQSIKIRESLLTVFAFVTTIFSPVKPSEMDWSALYPHYFATASGNTEDGASRDEPASKRRKYEVHFADIGCGYGGLLGIYSNLINAVMEPYVKNTPEVSSGKRTPTIKTRCCYCSHGLYIRVK